MQMGLPGYDPEAASSVTLAGLAELALDLRWSHDRNSEAIWEALAPQRWRATHNPRQALAAAPAEKMQEVIREPDFIERVQRQVRARQEYLSRPKWFERTYQTSALRVAYFSMEFGLSAGFPVYAGGLGVLAGDHLKSASDLGVPLIGVTLFCRSGYFRQALNAEGEQQEVYPNYDPAELPIRPVREAGGEWLRIGVEMPGRIVYVRAWEAQVGCAKLYLLDSDDTLNSAEDRAITSRLYGGDTDLRIKQEIILGIGGWRLLEALDLRPNVCHFNEGHTAFAMLERARSFMTQSRKPFGVALRCTRASNIFTTHTAVPEGLDSFSPELFGWYFHDYAGKLGVPFEQLIALGRTDAANTHEPFKMAYLALRACGYCNAVSRLHGRVSRRLFHAAFPHWPEREVPIEHLTNGVHVPSWTSAQTASLWQEAGAGDHGPGNPPTAVFSLEHVSDEELWEMRSQARKSLVDFLRQRQTQPRGFAGGEQLSAVRQPFGFDPQSLTLGFARRFVAYKRPDLLLYDPARLTRIVTNPQRPVQLVIAGKAHPSDNAGKAAVRRWLDYIRRPEVNGRVIFVEDYELAVGAALVRGVDLWINNPRRPWEACGTSGMKVVLNGGLNVSTLDGWWDEAYSPEVGWALGDRAETADVAQRDRADAETLYWLLEHEVIPTFYNRDQRGVATEWVARIRESMMRLAPWVSSWRMMREYVERYYIPAQAAFERRAAQDGALAAELESWSASLSAHWRELSFGKLRIKGGDTHYVMEVEVNLGAIDPEAVRVEMCAEAVEIETPVRVPMERAEKLEGASNRYLYRAVIPATQPVGTYVPRIVPHHPQMVGCIEAPQIFWAPWAP
jgi:starch phosphorylase